MERRQSRYRINLVRKLRELERQAERKHRYLLITGVACFALFAMALAYSGLTMWEMEKVILGERRKLQGIQAEYRKYTATGNTVDKADVELLNRLQGRGILWTKKLAAMATHLPDNYAITGFSYSEGELRVTGIGVISASQDQLLVLDGYLNRLRKDSTFSDVFRKIHLNRAQRSNDEGSGRFNFEFSAINAEPKKKK